MPRTPSFLRSSSLWLAIAGIYWLLLFAATHWPRSVPGIGQGHLDKVVHFAAFALLVALVAVACASRVGRLTWSALVAVVLVVAIYGAIDEVSQPLFGRYCHLYDWLADVAGAATGAAFFALIGNRLVARFLSTGDTQATASS